MKVEKSVLMDYKILILSTVIVFMFTTLSLAYDLREYYPLSQGDSWTYSVIEGEESERRNLRIDGEEIVNGIKTVRIFSGEDEYNCIAFDSEGIKKYKEFDIEDNEYEIYNPPKLIFPNIEIGEVKEYSTNWIEYGMNGEKKEEGTETGQIKLESIENIEVPAGRFTDCLKFSIFSEEKDTAGNYEKGDCSVWLALGVGKVKEFCIDTEYEAETQKEDTSIEIVELVSAVVDGKRIGRQE